MENNVVKFPIPTELDKQFLELEKLSNPKK